MVEQCMIVRQA